MTENLVSIIMPAYNCAGFIEEAIKTVLIQTYQDWELIIIDDKSTDNTKKAVSSFLGQKHKIRYIELKKNSGAAVARNKGIGKAWGRYIAFFDSDDLWRANKLEKQIGFMKEHNYAFTFTAYDLIDEAGHALNQYIAVPKQIDYDTLLYDTPIFTSTVVYDRKQLQDMEMPELHNGEDVAAWLEALKKVTYAYGIQECLASYRNRKHSLSTGIVTKLKRRWQIYRRCENIPVMEAGRLYMKYLFSVVKKRKRGSFNND